MPRPRVHQGLIKDMVNAINKRLGVAENNRTTLNAFDAPSSPSQAEIVMTHRLGISAYSNTEISIVDALRSLKIESVLISQCASKISKDSAKDVANVFSLLATESIATEFEAIKEKYYIQIQSMEQEYQHALKFDEIIRTKYSKSPYETLKLSIVLFSSYSHLVM